MCRGHNRILTSSSELLTPYEHPLIDQVPGVQGLHLATGGSYHCFKFFLVLGKIVAAYLRGTRSGVTKRWGDGAGTDLRKIYLPIVGWCQRL